MENAGKLDRVGGWKVAVGAGLRGMLDGRRMYQGFPANHPNKLQLRDGYRISDMLDICQALRPRKMLMRFYKFEGHSVKRLLKLPHPNDFHH